MAPGLSGSGVFSFGALRVLAVNAAILTGAAGGNVGASVLEKYISGRLGGTDGIVEDLAALVGATVSTRVQVGASLVPKTKLSLLAWGCVLDVATFVGRLQMSYLVLQATAIDSALC